MESVKSIDWKALAAHIWRQVENGIDVALVWNTQDSTLQLCLLKLGAWIESSVRRIVIYLPTVAPFADD